MNHNRIFALALTGAMLLSLTACGQTETVEETETTDAGVAVQVESLALDSISTENKVSGKVESDSQQTIMVATTAKCAAVYVKAGDTVKAGDKLCTLDLGSTLANYNAANISYQSTVKQYEDQKALLEKQIALAENNLTTTKMLFEIGAASQLEVDNAQITLDQAIMGRDSALAQLEAGIQSGKSGLEQLDMLLEHVDGQGNVISPIAGSVVSLYVTENGYTSSSTPIAIIDGAEQMKVTVYVSEALVPKLAAGDSVDVSVSSANQTFTGTIRSVEKAANIQTKLYTVTISIPAEVGGLMAGMFADVTFHTDTAENTIVIPTEALLTSGTAQYVYVVEENVAKYVEVTTGLTGNGVTEITSGLTEGQQLVTVGQSYLSDGAAVRVVSGEG